MTLDDIEIARTDEQGRTYYMPTVLTVKWESKKRPGTWQFKELTDPDPNVYWDSKKCDTEIREGSTYEVVLTTIPNPPYRDYHDIRSAKLLSNSIDECSEEHHANDGREAHDATFSAPPPKQQEYWGANSGVGNVASDRAIDILCAKIAAGFPPPNLLQYLKQMRWTLLHYYYLKEIEPPDHQWDAENAPSAPESHGDEAYEEPPPTNP